MPSELLDEILATVGAPGRGQTEVRILGADPVLPTRFRIGEASAACLAAVGVAASNLWQLRTGRRQSVEIEVRAATAALVSFLMLRGWKPDDLIRDAGPITALFRAKDRQWVHLHGGFPHLRIGLLELLGCEGDADSIAAAVSGWDAQTLEDEIAARRLCGARVRNADEWRDHPQGQALAKAPLVEIRRIADGPVIPLPNADRPLSGIRVLDLTRVLAGPTCARTLAEHGADVMRIHADHLPTIHPFAIDTGHGKLSTSLDLRSAADADRFRGLLRETDIVSRGFRPGALEGLGFGLEDLVAERPGIIAVAINCYGHSGPWAERAGWEQLAQTVTGVAAEHGGAESPKILPAAATDYMTGYLAAFGAMTALHRRATEGGSYEVRISLARTSMWLLGMSRVDGTPAGLTPKFIESFMRLTAYGEGTIHHLGPVLNLSETPPHWSRPTVPLGTHPPIWPDRAALS